MIKGTSTTKIFNINLMEVITMEILKVSLLIALVVGVIGAECG